MIDKLDLRVPRHAPFTPAFNRLYRNLRALPKGPFHAAKYYEYAGDLREYGHNVRLNLYCQMDTVGNHKLELIDVGTMSRREMLREITSVFEVDPLDLGIMRVDFAVDVPGIPLSWFRETVYAQQKRFRAAITGEALYAEMGTNDIQTLYYGKRPNVIRIYNKQAEYLHQYRKLIRKLDKNIEPPSFESVTGCSDHDSILTRVERQIGGRIPVEIETLGQVIGIGFEFKPFAKLQIIDHAQPFEADSNLSFETHCTGMYLRSMAERDGMQALRRFVSKRSGGNTRWALEKYRSFLLSATSETGLSGTQLQERFQHSLQRQMNR